MEVIIDNKKYLAQAGQTILDVCKQNGIDVPTLCYLKDVCEESNCRICVVETSAGNLIPACSSLVQEGMDIKTMSPKVVSSRKNTLKMLLSVHHKDCEHCEKQNKCALQNLFEQYGIEDVCSKDKTRYEVDNSSSCIVRDNNKCILCSRCQKVCSNIQSVNALTKLKRGYNTKMGCAFDEGMKQSPCVGCGQCTLVCPTGALVEKSEIKQLEEILSGDYFVTAQIAPSVRVALSEEFGAEIGTFDEGKMVAALKLIGFDKVFDINMGADFTVKEEAEELVERIKHNKNLPQFSSCCPAWFKFVQNHFKSYETSLSSCKSPTEMLGAIVKNYYTQKENIPREKIKVVGIMPCTAKKGEKERAQDVDVVLTTREMARLIKSKNIDFNNIKPQTFDRPLSTYSGASLLFGVSGGVTEATLRYACHLLGEDKVEFNEVRGSTGIKEVDVTAGSLKLKLCVVSGLKNARRVVEEIMAGKHYDFVEVMACPGGCINGGGQPIVNYDKIDVETVKAKRSKSIYDVDQKMDLRASYENYDMNRIYEEFFLKDKARSHALLHYRDE